MGITLPTGDILVIPEPPQAMRTENPELYQYFNKLRGALQDFARGQFNNTFTVATAINGTSGTFVIASGGHIVVTSGIVISVSTT